MTHPPKNSRPRSLAYRLNLPFRQTRQSNPGVSAIPCRPSLMKATSSSTKCHQPKYPSLQQHRPMFRRSGDPKAPNPQVSGTPGRCHRQRVPLGLPWICEDEVQRLPGTCPCLLRRMALRSSEEVISCRPVLLFARVPGLGPQPLAKVSADFQTQWYGASSVLTTFVLLASFKVPWLLDPNRSTPPTPNSREGESVRVLAYTL